MTQPGESVGASSDAPPVAEAPPIIAAEAAGAGYRYKVDGRPTRSVTQVLGDGYPKPALVDWAARETATYAVEHSQELADLGPIAAYQTLERARYLTSDRAKARGTDVHCLAERIAAGESVEVDPAILPYVDAAVAFLETEAVELIVAEQIVASTRYGYAGRLDLIADTRRGRALLDYKTTTKGYGPFAETALQLAAYRHAEWHARADRLGRPLPAVPALEVEWCGAVMLRHTGRYDLYPVDTGPAVHRAFLYVAEVAKIAGKGGTGAAYIGDPL